MIYKMKRKDINKLIGDFNKTLYGKTIFILCYISFVVAFVWTLIALYVYAKGEDSIPALVIVFSGFMAFLTFSFGSYAYYKELRIFASKEK